MRTHSAQSILVPLKRLFPEKEQMHEFLDAYDQELIELHKKGVHLTWQEELDMLKGLHFQMDDPQLGYKLGQSYGEAQQGALGQVMRAADTLREALMQCMRYLELSYAFYRYELAFSAKKSQLVFRPCEDFSDLSPTLRDREMVAVWRLLHSVTEGQIDLQEVQFSCDSEADKSFVKRYWSCPVKFGMPVDAFVFSSESLSQPLPCSNPNSFQSALDTCRQWKARLRSSQSVSEQVRELIKGASDTCLSIEAAAGHFSVSSRTLRRYLLDEGTTFRALVDEIRFERAKRLLSLTDLSYEAIAQQLGYQSTSNFNHAFRRWAKTSPGRYRRGALHDLVENRVS